jgi:threonine aldolase
MFGGGMRQAGILAAAGLIALEKGPQRLCEDHENARLLAENLSRVSSLDLDPAKVITNVVVVGISRTGLDSGQMVELLKSKGVLIGTVDATTIRLLTHLDVSRNQILEAARIISTTLAADKAT